MKPACRALPRINRFVETGRLIRTHMLQSRLCSRCCSSSYPDRVPSLTACVYFNDLEGKQYGHVTAGSSVYEATSEALDWFTDPHWRGPRPTPSTVLEVTLVGDERRWRVPARKVNQWRSRAQPRRSGESAIGDKSRRQS